MCLPEKPDAEALALVRRATARTMEILERVPIWGNPISRLAIHIAVERSILLQVQVGERDELLLCATALDVVRGPQPAGPGVTPPSPATRAAPDPQGP